MEGLVFYNNIVVKQLLLLVFYFYLTLFQKMTENENE